MAVLYATGWEAGSLGWYSSSQAAWSKASLDATSISSDSSGQHRTQNGVGGNYSINIDDGFYSSAGLVTAGVARWINFWMSPESPGSSRLSVQFSRSGTVQVNVHFLSTGTITIFRSSTSLTSVSGAYVPTVAHWISIECTCQDAGGVVNVYVDGSLVANYTGDTKNSATLTDWDQLGFGSSLTTGGLGNNAYYIDDLIITDSSTGRVSEHYIVPMTPNGNGSVNNFTSSSGNPNYQNVDELPYSDADYNSTTTSGHEDMYTMSNPPAATSILCANFCVRATRDGSLTQGQVSVKSNSTTVYSSAETLPASPSYYSLQYLVENNPDGSVPWDDSSISNVEAGFKVTT